MTASPDGDSHRLGDRLGHRFADAGLVRRALRHPSAPDVVDGRARSYQRLEFLGDRVLGLVIAEMVFRRFPDSDEGELSRRLTRLVRKETCADVAVAVGLGDAIDMGEGEEKSGGRHKRAILGDVCEAVIAALYLDGGLDAATRFINANWEPLLGDDGPLRDPKTALQEWAHKNGFGTPHYAIIDRRGPDHNPEFTVEATVPGGSMATGSGPSKRKAEQAAAEAILRREGTWPNYD